MIPGFVLAGGASERMGRDKALLPISGQPMASRTAHVLQRAGCAPVALVGRQPGLVGLGHPVVTEPSGVHHPLVGVWAALACTTQPLALFAPCDLAHLTPDAVRSLLAQQRPCRAEAQPLLCILPVTMAHRARVQAQRGGSVRAFVADLPAVPIDADVLLNVNTPMDLARVR